MVYMLPSFNVYIYCFCDTRLHFLYSSGLFLKAIVYSFVVSRVTVVFLLCTLCIYFCISKSVFTCHSEWLWFLLRKLVWNLTAVPLGYCFTCFGGIFFCKVCRLLLYIPRIFLFQFSVFLFGQCCFLLSSALSDFHYYTGLHTFTFEYERFLFKLSGWSIYISLECWCHITFY